MIEIRLILYLTTFSIHALLVSATDHSVHGPIPMGPVVDCDDGQTLLSVDFDNNSTIEYDQCQPSEIKATVTETEPKQECLPADDVPKPLHICMNQKITYKDIPPRGGPHRPVWPVYGEYMYIPPQRWIHSMEHGGIVMLYHPCANIKEVRKLKNIVKGCLRRHVITPYRQLSLEQPLALMAYQCKLTMSKVDEKKAVKFIRENALNPNHSLEYNNWRDGRYNYSLLHKAEIVKGSDMSDTHLCPSQGGDKWHDLLVQLL